MASSRALRAQHVPVVFWALVGFAVTGCNSAPNGHKGEKVDTPLAKTADAQSANVPPKLPKPLKDLDGPTLKAWIDGASGPVWSVNDIEVARQCKGSTECTNGTKQTKVKIQPVAAANNLDLTDLPGDVPVLLLRMHIPKETVKLPSEYRYDLIDDTYMYYVVVERKDPANRIGRWTLLQLDEKNNLTVKTSGDIRSCEDHTTNLVSHAYFTTCATRHDTFAQVLRDNRSLLATDPAAFEARIRAAAAGYPLTDAWWVSCIHGCCIDQGT